MNFRISAIVSGNQETEYIEKCLESLVNQSINKIQVIMIDEAEENQKHPSIMDRYAAAYENFEVVHKPHKGAGTAWNEGIRYAAGDYLSFVESCDYLDPSAYEALLQCADHTHSEVITGGINHFNSKKNYRSWASKQSVIDSIENTSIFKNPQLVYDSYPWNKLFKRSFWKKYDLVFPENIDDQALLSTIPAYILSDSISTVDHIIYYRRIKTDYLNASRLNINAVHALSDFLSAADKLNDFMKTNHVPNELIMENQLKYLRVDFPKYMNRLSQTEMKISETFGELLHKELNTLSKQLFRRLPSNLALCYRLVEQGKMKPALELAKMSDGQILKSKPYNLNGHWYRKLPISGTGEDYPVCIDSSLKAISRIHKIKWNVNGQLEITGHAYIEGIDSKRQSKVRLSGTMVNLANEKEMEVPVLLNKDRTITKLCGLSQHRKINPFSRIYNYDWSYFTICIDPVYSLHTLDKGKWIIFLSVDVNGIKKQVRLGNPLRGSNSAGFRIIRQTAWDVAYNGAWYLAVNVYKPNVLITKCAKKEDCVILEGTSEGVKAICALPKKLHLTPDEIITFNAEKTGEKTFAVKISADDFLRIMRSGDEWDIGYYLPAESLPYSAKAEIGQKKMIFDFQEQEIWIENSRNKLMIRSYHFQHPVLNQLEFDEFSLKLAIKNETVYTDHDSMICSRQIRFEPQDNAMPISADLPEISSEHAASSVTLKVFDPSGNFRWFTETDWRVFVQVTYKRKTGETQVIKLPVIVPEALKLSGSNVLFTMNRLKFFANKGAHDTLLFRTKLGWSFLDRSKRRRNVVKNYLYPLMRFLPLKKNLIVFESFWGKAFNDNPRAIYEQIYQEYGNKYKYVWFLENEFTPLSRKAAGIRKGSWRYYYCFARAKYLVENGNFPNFYVKRKGQTEMQTLHGTFLKTMGFDEKPAYSKKSQQQGLLLRSGRWDLLISPSPYMTKITKGAYHYKNRYIECGFPRNDILYKGNNQDYISKLKNKLGLPENKKVILYAPTFRSQDSFDLRLDFRKLSEKLSRDYIVLLRLHYFISSRVKIEGYNGFIYNVSSYPEIQDLYLVSDLMITDYSSVMFDYAHLKRPMIFYAYDLDYYRNDLRGIYLNYEETVPGPIVKNMTDLIDKVIDPSHAEKYQLKYEQFYNKFCTFGRGESAKQAVRCLLKSKNEEYSLIKNEIETNN